METNNTFSLRRFMLLCRQSLILNKKIIGMAVIGFIGMLVISLIFLQSGKNLQYWNTKDFIALFFIFFFILGIVYISLSFPAFRTKERSINYLTLPASISEKYVFEIGSRFIVFLVAMPLLFWLVVNAECSVVHHYAPHFQNYKFSFSEAYAELIKKASYVVVDGEVQFDHKYIQTDKEVQYLFIQGGLFVFIFSFAGASHFSKSPFLKTLFTFSIITAGYFLLGYLLYKVLDLDNYHLINGRNIFFNKEKDVTTFLAYVFTIINLCFLTISFFRLKEKEV